LTSLVFWLWICGQLKQRSCPHTHSHYYDFDPVNTNFHRKDKLHFKNGTFCVLTDGSTLISAAGHLWARIPVMGGDAFGGSGWC